MGLVFLQLLKCANFRKHGHFVNDMFANYVLGESVGQVRVGADESLYFWCFSVLFGVGRLNS